MEEAMELEKKSSVECVKPDRNRKYCPFRDCWCKEEWCMLFDDEAGCCSFKYLVYLDNLKHKGGLIV